ncbi:MAG: hypothetical protein HBSAPP03_29500 [Phycisphaerae bacterium]|nr:MAG: hypothetical protein HBSAPP03_29500 [Phycisphaerae bacterium]
MSRWVLVVLLAWLVLVATAWVWMPPDAPPLCPFRRATGYPCPTCGSTRAAVAFLTGRPADALALNPFMSIAMVLTPLFIAWRFSLGRRWAGLSSRTCVRLIWLALVLLALNWGYLLWTNAAASAS